MAITILQETDRSRCRRLIRFNEPGPVQMALRVTTHRYGKGADTRQEEATALPLSGPCTKQKRCRVRPQDAWYIFSAGHDGPLKLV